MDTVQLHKIVLNLLKQGENEWIEFKSNQFEDVRGFAQSIGERISALANSSSLEGQNFGYIVFGVDDSGTVIGTNLDFKTLKIGNEPVENRINTRMSPSVSFKIYNHIIQDKNLVIVEVPCAIDRPISFSHIEYIRIGSITRKLSDFPDKESTIWKNLHHKVFETEIAKQNISGSDILQLLDYSLYFKLLGEPIPDSAVALQKMEQEGFLINSNDGTYSITNLGAILFANKLSLFIHLQRKVPRVIIYAGNNKVETIKEKEFDEGYAISFEKIVNYIIDQLPVNEEIVKAFRKDNKMYPDIAIRELVANALIHQNLYESGIGPMIEVFSDRIEISNPGRPLIDVNRFLDHPPRSRNESLASFMRRIKICEERGSGIDKVITYIELYQLPAPKFEVYEQATKVTLYALKKVMSKREKVRACYWHVCLKYVVNDFANNASVRARFDITSTSVASQLIRETLNAKLIKLDDETANQKFYRYIPIRA